MAKRDDLLNALKQKAPSKPAVKAGEAAAAKAIEQEEERSQPKQTEPAPKPARRKIAKKKSKRALSIVLGEEELRILRPIQQQFEDTHQRTCGLATAIKIAVRAMKPKTDISAIAQALIEEDQRGKRL